MQAAYAFDNATGYNLCVVNPAMYFVGKKIETGKELSFTQSWLNLKRVASALLGLLPAIVGCDEGSTPDTNQGTGHGTQGYNQYDNAQMTEEEANQFTKDYNREHNSSGGPAYDQKATEKEADRNWDRLRRMYNPKYQGTDQGNDKDKPEDVVNNTWDLATSPVH